jgi:hypothetical protein
VATGFLGGGRPFGNSFVLPKHKIVYVSVTKVACTSLRWMVADLAGEDKESFYSETGAQQTRLMTIHGPRDRWKNTPQLLDLRQDQLDEISSENGWLIFAVVRDPWSRLWSAWQSKFLVRHAGYVDRYSEEPWFPRVPETAADVVEDFASFVLARPWETHELLRMDYHFKPQTHSVRPRRVRYTKVYDLPELPTLFRDVKAHLESLGMPRELYTPRANETPLRLTRAALSPEVLAVIEDAYREDFETFDMGWTLDRVKVAPDGWSADAIAHTAYHAAANERIGDLRAEARRIRRELVRQQRANEQLLAETAELRAGLLRRAVRKMRG